MISVAALPKFGFSAAKIYDSHYTAKPGSLIKYYNES